MTHSLACGLLVCYLYRSECMQGALPAFSVAYCAEANTFSVTHCACTVSTRRFSRLITHAARVIPATLVGHHCACNYNLETRHGPCHYMHKHAANARARPCKYKETRCAAYQRLELAC